MFYFYYETIGAEQLGKMNYYTHWVEEHRGYKKAIEEASDHFEEHWSTHQTIIDEKNKRFIYPKWESKNKP